MSEVNRGIYKVTTVNVSWNYEGGYIDDWDYHFELVGKH